VQVLPGLRFPEVLGFQKEAIHHTFVVPAEECVCNPIFRNTTRANVCTP